MATPPTPSRIASGASSSLDLARDASRVAALDISTKQQLVYGCRRVSSVIWIYLVLRRTDDYGIISNCFDSTHSSVAAWRRGGAFNSRLDVPHMRSNLPPIAAQSD